MDKTNLSTMHTCIYCLKCKSAAEFNVEHVLNDAFGQYDTNALTLIDKVCAACNKTFGDTIDNALARATMEGVQRFKSGIKKLREFQSSKHDRNSEIIVREKIMQGLRAERANIKYANGNNAVGITPKYDDVGFRKEDGTYDFYSVADIPEPEIANIKYPEHSERIFILPHRDPKIVVDAISKKWNVSQSDIEYITYQENDEELLTEVITEYSVDVLRAYAKITFNYLAYFNETDVMLHPIFNAIRDFIVKGKQPGWQCISITAEPILENEKNSTDAIEVHIITSEKISNSIVCRVSLFNRLQMIVALAHNYNGLPIKVGFSNWFDPHGKKVGLIAKSALICKAPSLLIPPRDCSLIW